MTPPGRVAQLKDVADVGFDGEILVDGPDERAVRFLADLVISDIGDGPAAGEGGNVGPACGPCSALPIAVAMEQAAGGRWMHHDHCVEVFA